MSKSNIIKTKFERKVLRSSDTNVFKFVFTKSDVAVEAVLYRYGSFRKRTVICCSTQCGCPVGCSFCGTGRGFVRSLYSDEIVDQIQQVMEIVEQDCPSSEIEKFQIMFMSMGKPFYNYCVHAWNSSDADVARLVSLFNPAVWETTLSVICEKDETVKASHERQLPLIWDFSRRLLEKGASVRIFDPAGQDDIGGGCGQLWFFQKWLREHRSK